MRTAFRWLFLTFNLKKTPLRKTGCLGSTYFLLTGCLGIQLFYSPPIPTQSVSLPLVTYPHFERGFSCGEQSNKKTVTTLISSRELAVILTSYLR